MTDTPRTRLRYEAISHARAFSAYENMHDLAKELETELTAARAELSAVTEQRDRLADQLDDAVAEATDAVNDIIRMKCQRDRLMEAMTRIINIYENPEKGCIPSSSDMYDEAFQSLATNEQ